MEKEIKKCPFPVCGGEAKLQIIGNSFDGPGYARVICTVCGVLGPVPSIDRYPNSKQPNRVKAEQAHDAEAIKLWNTRNDQ